MLTNLHGRFAAVLIVMAATALSCSESTAPEVGPGFQLLELPGTTHHDTVRTELPGMLVAALYDSAGRPRANTEVSIQAVRPPDVQPLFKLLLLRDAMDSSRTWSSQGIQLRTDAAGIVRARVKLGDLARDIAMLLVAQSPAGAVTDTVHFLVNPGAPVVFALEPRDTALYEGGSYPLRAVVLDAYGNARGDKATTHTDSTSITVTTDGSVRARHIGRGVVRGTLGGRVDSAWVSVVPHGVLVASRPARSGQPDQLLQFELDGSNLTVIDARTIEQPSISPSGTRIVFIDRSERAYLDGGRIFVREPDGVEHPLLPDYVAYQEKQMSPRFSADEKWVYYAGGIGSWSIWRVHLDGTGSEIVVGPPSDGGGAYIGTYDPTPSRDGRYLAYLPTGSSQLRIRDLSSGDSVVGPGAQHLRWIPGTDLLVASSPDGFAILQPDGTVAHSVAVPLEGESPFDISPDGRWIAVSTYHEESGGRYIDLVNLDNGMRLPLGFSDDMGSLAWHP